MSNGKYIAFDGEDFHVLDTKEDARRVCEDAITHYRGNASSDGWPDEMGEIMWGRVVARCVAVDYREHMDSCGTDLGCDTDCSVPMGFDSVCDYALEAVSDD